MLSPLTVLHFCLCPVLSKSINNRLYFHQKKDGWFRVLTVFFQGGKKHGERESRVFTADIARFAGSFVRLWMFHSIYDSPFLQDQWSISRNWNQTTPTMCSWPSRNSTTSLAMVRKRNASELCRSLKVL